MTAVTETTRAPLSGLSGRAPVLFAAVVFLSATLVFLVEPMVAKLLLPSQGGSPMVWNTCMAFFQIALLAGYGYAHLLQRVSTIRNQALIHVAVLVVSLVLAPVFAFRMDVTGIVGEPNKVPPALWLLGVLTLMIGAPFAALSATAPLAQAWYARVRAGHDDAKNPYVLYAASNLGSLIALIAYPVIVEPSLKLSTQTLTWTLGFAAFVALMAVAASVAARSQTVAIAAPAPAPKTKKAKADAASEAEAAAQPITWRQRLIWIGLAAAPSSLMLGVTTHLTTDIASTPFLWVVPLALYLVTFIIAFQNKPLIDYEYSLLFQGVLVAMVAVFFGLTMRNLLAETGLHLAAFFFTALICHQGLSRSKPHPSKLTEFFFLMSVGGVIGGGFNAFVAPVIFNSVWEYPLVLVLACFGRPWLKQEKPAIYEIILLAAAGLIMASVITMHFIAEYLPRDTQFAISGFYSSIHLKLIFALAAVAAFLIRDRALMFAGLVSLIMIASINNGVRPDVLHSERSFFGVLRVTRDDIRDKRTNQVYSEARSLAHGTTLHGVQAVNSALNCEPLVYYARPTPIGQVFESTRARKGRMTIGAIGMGTGTVAAYTQPGDELRFFEIDKDVVKMSGNGEYFTYIKGCSRGRVDYVLGDARLTLRRQPKGVFDILLVDAFSSDAVPAHLLTVEAMKEYLSHVTDDGIVIMHLSNRHLDLMSPVAAVAQAAGGHALMQNHNERDDMLSYTDTGEEAIIVARNPAALAPYRNDPRWEEAPTRGVAPWTDDYMNLFGAMWRREVAPLGERLRKRFFGWMD